MKQVPLGSKNKQIVSIFHSVIFFFFHLAGKTTNFPSWETFATAIVWAKNKTKN